LSVGFCTAVVAAGTLVSGGLGLSASAAGADRPDTFAAAKSGHVSANGAWQHESLSSANDVDWFRFTVAQPARGLVTLGHLAAGTNYALAVFDAHHHVVGESDHGGNRFEELYRSFGAGDYLVRVMSTSGANPDVDYFLKFRPLAHRVVIAESRAVHDSSGFSIKGELLNNTGKWMQLHRIHVTWLNSKGNTVGTCDEGVIPGPVAPHARIEFDIENGEPRCGDQPANAASYKLRIFADTTKERTPGGLAFKPGQKSETKKQRIYKGTVTNNSNTTLHGIYPTVVEYDRLGRAIAFGYDRITTLAPGQTRTYTAAIDTAGLPKPNGTRQHVSITG
jgi:hypothetical protein